jgi:hypothetical protein
MRKNKRSLTVPSSLQHPPRALKQETDRPYVIGAAVVALAVLGAGLVVSPAPGVVWLGPLSEVSSSQSTGQPSPTTTPPTGAVAAHPVAPETGSTASAPQGSQVAAAAAVPAATTGATVGGGGTSATTTQATQPITGIKPVDNLLNGTLHRIDKRLKKVQPLL